MTVEACSEINNFHKQFNFVSPMQDMSMMSLYNVTELDISFVRSGQEIIVSSTYQCNHSINYRLFLSQFYWATKGRHLLFQGSQPLEIRENLENVFPIFQSGKTQGIWGKHKKNQGNLREFMTVTKKGKVYASLGYVRLVPCVARPDTSCAMCPSCVH